MRSIAVVGFTLGILFLGGCATRPVNYHYGNYSRTLYRVKKDSTEESRAKHRASLQEIISTSERKGWRVPPGIYFEYGYILATEGNVDADRFFELEVKTYPESERFVSFVRSQMMANAES